MAPWVLVGLAALVGLAVRGAAGLLVGAVVGIALASILGFFVRKAQGGLLPSKVRRELIVNLLTGWPNVISEAFPGLEGDALFKAIEQVIEGVARRAVSLAPSNSEVWSAPVVARALEAAAAEEPSQEMKAFYFVVSQEIARGWYGPQ